MNLSACAFIAIACLMLSPACSSGDDDASSGSANGGSTADDTGGAPGSEKGGSTADDTGGAPGAGDSESTCDSGCAATIAAHCPHGPTDQAGCVGDCEVLLASTCAAPYSAFQTCAVGEAITCNSDGIPAVAACADEQAAFIACLN
jgi:hypothetical protein